MSDFAKQQVRMVFSDVDGTLVGGDHHPIEASAATMHEVGARVPVCLVSARSPEGLYSIQQALGFAGPLACFSGAYVLGENGEELYSTTMTAEDARDIKDYLSQAHPQLCVGTYGHHTWIVDDRSHPSVQREEEAVQTQASESRDIVGTFGKTGVHKLLLMGSPDAILDAERVVGARYPHLNVVRSSDILCEVMTREASKRTAVRVICEHYGIDPTYAVAFGDGPNDMDMLLSVRNSYAMANAEEAVKEAATHVLPWTNEECGVARMLAQLLDL